MFIFPREVKQLLKLDVDVNEKTSNGITPMHWACGLGDDSAHLNIVRLLLSSLGDPNVRSSEGLTPVHVAASWGFLEVMKVLIAHGGDPWLEDQDGSNAWDLALQKNQWTILKYLTSYMDDEQGEADQTTDEPSIQCVFVKHREVDLASSLSSTISCNNMGFLGSESLMGKSSNGLDEAICHSLAESSVTSSTSSVVVVEEHVYTDPDKGIDLVS